MPTKAYPSTFAVGITAASMLVAALCTWALLTLPRPALGEEEQNLITLGRTYPSDVQPLLKHYCHECHSGDVTEAEIDFARFGTLADVRRHPQTWQKVAEMLDSGQMPPEDARHKPTEDERTRLRQWVRGFLTVEAKARAGDPGRVILRRLSNAEYTYTLRDLTGVESLDPAREFPLDGAAGEGFTNAGSALVMSPALVTKYLDAAKEVAAHAVLLPDGFRFSPHTTRRDWTNENLERIREFYRQFTDPGGGDQVNLQGIVFETNQGGRLPVEKYLTATLAERDSLRVGEKTIEAVAREHGLNARYLGALWSSLTSSEPSPLLDGLRARWREARPADAAALAADVAAWQQRLWRFATVGHIGKVGGPKQWLEPVNPAITKQDLQFPIPATPNPKENTPSPIATGADNGRERKLIESACDDFRRLFPAALCYTKIVPVDEVVTLTLFYREDDHLVRLMLDETQQAKLDRLWDELHYASHDALTQVDAFAQLMEYATQDADPTVFEPLREPIHERAANFRQLLIETEPKHLDALIDFAARAYRRPLTAAETVDLRALFEGLRRQDLSHEEAFRLALARVLVAPAFLYRIEQPPDGAKPGPVTDCELASRLSYFLWSSQPDDELRRVAAAGELRDTETLVTQTRRMLHDEKTRRLATEFACQWLQIYDFDNFDEKSERHFPTFAGLRGAMYEESIRFFTDLFQNNGSVLDILDADYTFLNEALATHYGVAGVKGVEWRRVEGMKRLSRGGILAQATTLARQSGASRTSPVLRGNWISEVLLGERLPRPPKGVPELPDEEAATEGLTIRQLVEKHASDPKCAVCHVRIDPLGFSLEGFDAIGRRRDKDLGDRPVDTRAKTVDGAEFEGLAGLRKYLLTTRREAFVRQFCRKLLGYALGRAVQLSDEPLLSQVQADLAANDYKINIAVLAIVRSPQFREIRGRDVANDD
ncbi:MAG: DUF1592 domain-containing protein [Pirellulales bacterium]